MTQRRTITLADADAVMAEVKRLRGAKCEQAGNWSLPQTCHHLNIIMYHSMRPGSLPPPPPPIENAKEALQQLMTQGRPPAGLKGPAFAEPPANVPDSTVDDFLKTLAEFKTFKGPFGPHRLFGNIPTEDFRRLHLMHCAHHLSHLVPTTN